MGIIFLFVFRVNWDLSIAKGFLHYTNQAVTDLVAERISRMHFIPIKMQVLIIFVVCHLTSFLKIQFSTPDHKIAEFKPPCITFSDFCNFFLSEIDVYHPASLSYWFTVFDDEGLGVISTCEVEKYYSEIIQQFVDSDDPAISFDDFIVEISSMFPRSATENGFKLSRKNIIQHPDLVPFHFNSSIIVFFRQTHFSLLLNVFAVIMFSKVTTTSFPFENGRDGRWARHKRTSNGLPQKTTI
jgi:hypothetical protein